MATVKYDKASRIYPGVSTPAVDSLDLEISDGEFLVLVGPSGCGKSTSLRMLAGLEEVDTGNIFIGDKNVTEMAPKDRDIAMVFQNYALYPHMSVGENMAFALKIAGISKDQRDKQVLEAAKMLDLENLLDRKPKALSGGQRQRVAMGRAIVRQPQVFLMDEPLSNLDAKLRVQTRTQIASLQRRLDVTTIYVTHDQTEALTMGDRIAVLDKGVLQQVGTPRELYATPVNMFVAGFIGSPGMNFLPTQQSLGGVQFGTAMLDIRTENMKNAEKDLVIGIRPEDLTVSAPGTPGLTIEVDVVEELGADGYLYGHIPGTDSLNPIVVRVDGRNHPQVGEQVVINPVLDHVHIFSETSGLRL